MTENISWRQFEAGRDYNQRIGLYENTATNERFYRGDQWKSVASGPLPTPVFNFVRRITDYLVAQASSSHIEFVYSDENLPFIQDEHHRMRINDATALLNRHAAFRWEKCHLDRLIHRILLDAALSGDGVFFTYWDPMIRTGQPYTGDFVTTTIDGANLFVENVNSSDLQNQRYVIISGRDSVEALRAEAIASGASREEAMKIKPDGDLHFGAGDCAAFENLDASAAKATYIIKFSRDERGFVQFEKSTENCVIRRAVTGLRLYPLAMFNWIPTKNSYHGASPITPLIQNQKYINKAYALMMKHMIDCAFSKVVYDKTRIPEWTNEVGQAIGVAGGNLEGIAATIKPGEMDEGFPSIIGDVIEHTKDSMGATDVSLGEAAPTNSSAIVALQESNAITLDSLRSSLYCCLEELAAIWVDFMCAYYGDGRMVLTREGGEPLDCRLLREELISARVDVGAATRFSKASALSELKNLLDGGHITLKQYLERVPDGVIPLRDKLIEETEANTADGTDDGASSNEEVK